MTGPLRLDGIHHISCITGDARRNVDFYTRVLGLRMVARTVNQDDPFVYHLFYADDIGSPGSDITFFEFPGAIPGRAGEGMIHRIVFRVGSPEALDFWESRLTASDARPVRDDQGLRFSDPEGLEFELVAHAGPDAPLIARQPEIPEEMAIAGFDGVRVFGRRDGSRDVLERLLGAVRTADWTWEIRGPTRGATIAFDRPPDLAPRPSAGTVHHVAWTTDPDQHGEWLARLDAAGVRSSGIVDRFYFRSIYFREPGGVLYELATRGPGFTVDSTVAELGTRLVLPPSLEPRRAEIESRLSPL